MSTTTTANTQPESTPPIICIPSSPRNSIAGCVISLIAYSSLCLFFFIVAKNQNIKWDSYLTHMLWIPTLMIVLSLIDLAEIFYFRHCRSKLQAQTNNKPLPDWLASLTSQYPKIVLTPITPRTFRALPVILLLPFVIIAATILFSAPEKNYYIQTTHSTIIALIMLLVGLYYVLIEILNLLTNKITFAVSSVTPHPGNTIQIEWNVPDTHCRFTKLEIILDALKPRKQVTPDLEDFFKKETTTISVFTTTAPQEINIGHAALTIPTNAPLSPLPLEDQNLWAIRLHLKHPFLPTITKDYPIFITDSPWQAQS